MRVSLRFDSFTNLKSFSTNQSSVITDMSVIICHYRSILFQQKYIPFYSQDNVEYS